MDEYCRVTQQEIQYATICSCQIYQIKYIIEGPSILVSYNLRHKQDNNNKQVDKNYHEVTLPCFLLKTKGNNVR